MLEFEWINSFANVHWSLPHIMRWSLFCVIALIALIPASLVALVIDSSTRSVIGRLLDYLKLTSFDLFEGIKSHRIDATEIITKFTQNNSVKYGFSPDLKNVDISRAQSAVDLIEQQGRDFPELLDARLSSETDEHGEIEERLSQLEQIVIGPIENNSGYI